MTSCDTFVPVCSWSGKVWKIVQKAAALRETGLCLGFELGLYTFENVSVFHLKTEEKAKKKNLSPV